MKYTIFFGDKKVTVDPSIKPNIHVDNGRAYALVVGDAPVDVCERLRVGDRDNDGYAEVVNVGNQTVVLKFSTFEINDNVLYLPDCYWRLDWVEKKVAA